MARDLLSMKWILGKNTMSMPFWTSDNPIYMDNSSENIYERYLGYKCPGIEISLPLNSQYSLTICDPEKYQLMPGYMETKSLRNVIYNNECKS